MHRVSSSSRQIQIRNSSPNGGGQRKSKLNIKNLDAKDGGAWRVVEQGEKGDEYAFHGVYHEVLHPERIISTFEFEGLPEKGHVVLETQKFEELPGGKTKLTVQYVYQSVADRDGMVQSGMERGITESYGRLDEILKEI